LGRTIACGLLREPAAVQVDALRTRAQGEAAARNIRAGQRAGELAPAVDAGLTGAAIIGSVRSMLADALSRTPPADQQDVLAAAMTIGTALLTRKVTKA